MARRSLFVTVAAIAALVAVVPAPSSAATAPAAAPVLTSAPFTAPVSFHWTPANDPLDLSQSVYRDEGVCATPVTEGGPIANFPGNATTDFTGNPVDGVYCYYIKAADLLTTANGPGLTVVVDTHDPTATIAVSNQVAGVVSGTVTVSGTSGDAVSGVAASVFHAGAQGSCAAGSVIGATWDTTTVADGPYGVCNVVTDNAGHVAVATTSVTVANPLRPAVAPAAAPAGAASGGAAAAAAAADATAPGRPRHLTLTLPRARAAGDRLRARLHWVKPRAADLDRVVVVLNRRHAPHGPSDGTRVYRGLGTSVALGLRPGQRGYVALFAYDHSGNVSAPARRLVAPAALIPLRPLSGSVVRSAPRLTWKPRAGSAYYNVQVFRNGNACSSAGLRTRRTSRRAGSRPVPTCGSCGPPSGAAAARRRSRI